jgi:peptidoglycan/LPS O-acetylase OafA/YrhL
VESVAAMTGAPPASVAGRWHIPALDGIRALAILLVIPHNVDVLNPPYPAFLLPVTALLHAGWIGVQLFFVLSGFLITGNLLDARGSGNYFSSFFGRRALRILPLYFAVLLIAFVVAPALVTLPQEFRATESNQVWLWTFLTNWTQPYIGGVYGFGHFWSLAVEEQFYLLWPLLVLRCGPRPLFWACLAAATLALVVRCLLIVAHAPHDTLYMFTVCRMDALALGAAAAALIRIPEALQRLRNAIPAVAVGAAVMLLATAAGTRAFAMYDVSTQTIGYTLLSLSFALIILLTTLPVTGVLHGITNVLSWAPLRLVGRYSYGMYVLHLPLHVFFGAVLLRRITSHPTPATALIYTAGLTVASFLVAAASYELFERRFLRMKRWLVPAVLRDNGAQAAIGPSHDVSSNRPMRG